MIIPGMSRPTNLVVPEGTESIPIDGDVYHICERIKEISPNLFIVLLWNKDFPDKRPYVIMEHCKDGVDRLVFKRKTLDQRILNDLLKIRGLPLEVRFKEAEKLEAKWEKEAEEEEHERMFEEVGLPMLKMLEECGFIQRPKSFAKRGVKANGSG